MKVGVCATAPDQLPSREPAIRYVGVADWPPHAGASPTSIVALACSEAGVRALFGVPGGGGNLDLIEAAGRAGLPFVLTATETGGAIAAIAQAEVTGSVPARA